MTREHLKAAAVLGQKNWDGRRTTHGLHMDTHKWFPNRNKVASGAWETLQRRGSKWNQCRFERNGKANDGGEGPQDPSSGKPRTPHSQQKGLHT